MSIMKDSSISDAWLREAIAKNPPRILENGNIFSGPVRLSFPHVFKVQPPRKNDPDAANKTPQYTVGVLFPVVDVPGYFAPFEQEWARVARAAFPKHWTPEGQPVNLHWPMHDQKEKAFGAQPLAGYTPGALYFTASSQFRPQVVDQRMQLVTDEAKVYAGVWAYVSFNAYSYSNRKTGVGFGLQSLMIAADDDKLGGGRAADPKADFGGVQITATSNVAAKFGQMPQSTPPAQAGVMPTGSYVGQAGTLPTHALPDADDASQYL